MIHAIAPESGGPSVSVPALCEALGALGHEVRLHVTSFGGVPQTPCRASYQLRSYPYLRGGGKQGVSPAMHRALREEAQQAHIVHSHGLWLLTNLSSHLAAKDQRAKVVLSPKGMLQPFALAHKKTAKRVLWKLWQQSAVRAAHCLHATSAAELASIRSMGLTNPVALIPNGVEMPAARPKPREGQRRLVFLGRMDPIKGVDLLLRAWSQVERDFPDWDLWVVGPSSGSYGEEMRALARTLGAQRAHFPGAAFDAQRDDHLARADLFVLPTRSENFGMVVAEALAAGTPVICSTGASWPELQSRECGYWIDVGIEPLASCLRSALALPRETLAEMGARGRAWMQADFAWREQASRLADVYAWLTHGGPAPATVSFA